ncbi:uncharacterized protein LOC130690130 [Daphnia carinata]|uniref:uncharacterized protein LOC130690130 n=1 Tax=Daphnia carinata TaxID=120202 RepID=UPI00257C7119|nr:uncharacterized protein LOC130690130 [Daphnia carinata]
MDASRPSMRARKVVNYAAMNGDRSDSEDDTVKCVNVKLTVPFTTVTKPSRLSKLKLGTRKTKLSKSDDTKLVNVTLKPILDDVEPTKLSMTSPCPTSNLEETELSIAEPELTTHSIFSQETVITSSCECLSPHEFTDSSESDTYCSTVEITSMKESAKLNTKCDPTKLKTNEDRIIKRRIISENLCQQKKVKIDTEETKNQNTFSVNESSVSKPDEDVWPVPLQISELPTCLLGTDKASPGNRVNVYRQLATSSTLSFGTHEEVSIFQTSTVQSPVQPTNQLVKHGHSSEIECFPGAITLNIVKTSDESGSIIKSATSALLTPKKTKSATKEGCTSKVRATKNTAAKLKLKDSLANLLKSKEKSNNTSAPTVIDEQIAKASLSVINGGNITELNTSRNVTSPPHSVTVLKPPSPQPRKLTMKWKPPGKASGISTPLGGTSPAIGIRLGLSRNRRASKPLHPDVKVKI